LNDPYNYEIANKLDEPVAESKYFVRIKAKKLGWQNFVYAANWLTIFPAHVLKDVNGAAYLRDYNFKFLPGSGPYIMTEQDIEKGKSISIRRRNDYWADKYRANVGQNNLDTIRFVVVRDAKLMFEMFKTGDLDFYLVQRSKEWVEELNFDKFQRGILIKRKVFNSTPTNIQFMAFNTRRKPWDDIRVRKALMLLYNREQLIQKLFYNEYLPI
jgi:ABC-type oligopeptide transport system substrate-binding subunit